MIAFLWVFGCARTCVCVWLCYVCFCVGASVLVFVCACGCLGGCTYVRVCVVVRVSGGAVRRRWAGRVYVYVSVCSCRLCCGRVCVACLYVRMCAYVGSVVYSI